ncbi:MAG: PAS domain-containing protein [Deltaproteobacteria bacterium]|nr:PAS domain-containing protein [Deltaproteobacteria bacterium]
MLTAEQKITAIMDGTCEGVTIIDRDMKIIWVNSVAESWLGALNEVKGSYCYSIYRNRNKICKDCPVVKSFRTGKIEKAAEFSCSLKGGKKYFELEASPIRNEKGKAIAVAMVTHDFTRILELEDKFKESSSRFRAIIDGIGDGISIIDEEFNIKRVNKAVLGIFNKSDFSEVLGRKCYQQYYSKNAPCDDCPAQRTFLEGKKSYSKRIWRDGKEKKVFDISTFPIKNGGNVSTVIECFRDMTGMVNLEDQLLHSERLAGVGELAAGIAHELRNPLSIISSSIQLCLKKHDVNEDVKRHLMIIWKNSENANRIISDLLDFAKPSIMSLKPGNINNVLQRVCNLVQSRCAKQSIKLNKKLQKTMPEMILDEKRLESSFINFILNSVDAMPEGGNLLVKAYHDHRQAEIEVSFSDTGKGIPSENLGRIFDPFFTTKAKGTGLGLSIAHNVIVCHKGKIDVQSEINKGTTITIRFPASK